MRIPPIDLQEVVKILKSEGTAELRMHQPLGTLITGGPFLKVMDEWNKVIKVLEVELVPALSKGGDLNMLKKPAMNLAKSASGLALMASEILSFVPGPIGIVCSIINAIVCFSTGNIPGGLLELLGCIPGAKVGIKGGSKVMAKIGEKITSLIMKNPELAKLLTQINKIGESFNAAKIKDLIKKMTPEHTFVIGPTYNLNFSALERDVMKKKGISANRVNQGKVNKGIDVNRYGIDPYFGMGPLWK